MRKKPSQTERRQLIGIGLIWLLTISLICIIFTKNEII